MITIQTKTSQKAFAQAINNIKQLIPKLQQNVRALAKEVHTVLEIDRERGMKELVAAGLSVLTVQGLERVGTNLVHEQVFLNGSAAAHLAETLKFKDQKMLVEKGVRVVTGGTSENPVVETVALKQFSSRMARQVINRKEHRFYTVQEQIELRNQRQQTKATPRYEVKDGQMIFHARRWNITELKTIVGNL